MTTSVTAGADLLSAVEAAIRAPSIHNTQPWAFGVGEDRIDVFGDRRRQLRVADPDGRALRVSCGAAIFNLRLGLAHLGRTAEVTLLPDVADRDLLASVTIGAPHVESPGEAALYAAIPRRRSNRHPFLDTSVSLNVRAELRAAAEVEGGWLDLLLGPPAVEMVAHLVRAADRIVTNNEEYRAELARWTGRDVDSVDGVPRSAAGPAPEARDLLVRPDFGGPPRAPGRDFESDPLVGVLGTQADTPREDLVAGQALQRMLLTATVSGLAVSLFSQPMEVPAVREELRVGLRRYGSPAMLLRVGYGIATPATPRRALSEVLRATTTIPSGGAGETSIGERPGADRWRSR